MIGDHRLATKPAGSGRRGHRCPGLNRTSRRAAQYCQFVLTDPTPDAGAV